MRCLYLLLTLVTVGPVAAQSPPTPPNTPPAPQTQPAGQDRPLDLMAGLGKVHHPVLTKSREAQRWFNQGLMLVYAFNHDEAVRSFQQATRIDPNMAMAYWGIAYALGPNINLPVDAEREKAAFEAVQKALKLASDLAPQEQAYIRALAKRYSDDPNADLNRLAVDYSRAMREVSKQYPDDLDATTLYAESLMNLHPWRLWRADGTPEEGTLEALAMLESVLRRNPSHTGANHYYIHAVEASPVPQRAYASAQQLTSLAPAAGHLVHMPSHIYFRMGDYAAACESNEQAVAADRAYIDRYWPEGVYPMMYYSHNMHFLAVSYGMLGNFERASTWAQALADHAAPHASHMGMLEVFAATPLLIQVRFERWNDILAAPAPDPALPAMNAIWRFARGVAFAATGDVGKAEAERAEFAKAADAIPADTIISPSNRAPDVMQVARLVLDARIALAGGDTARAVQLLREAVRAEDSLGYMEPPDWYLATREYLGGVLLAEGKPAEAEKVFRENLEKYPLSGRSLFGLMLAVRGQPKVYESQLVQEQFMQSWEYADTILRAEALWAEGMYAVPARQPDLPVAAQP